MTDTNAGTPPVSDPLPTPRAPDPGTPGGGSGDGPQKWPSEQLISAAAGFVLLLIMTVIAVSRPDLERNFIILVVLSSAAAAFVAIVPGMLNLEVPGVVKASGAIAVFAAVFFYGPKIPTPTGDNINFIVPETGVTTFDAAVGLIQAKNAVTITYGDGCVPALLTMKLRAGGYTKGPTLAKMVENLLNLRDPSVPAPVKSVSVIHEPANALLRMTCK